MLPAKKVFRLTVILCLLLLAVVVWWNGVTNTVSSVSKVHSRLATYISRPVENKNLPIHAECQSFLTANELENEKHVIFWNIPCGDRTVAIEYVQDHYEEFNKSTGRFVVNSPWCGRCRFETSRENYETSDAIVFHATGGDGKLPEKRNDRQLYAWWGTESTRNNGLWLRRDFFNIMMSYRRNHDVYIPYSSLPWTIRMLKEKHTDNDPMKQIASYKQGKLASAEELLKAQQSVPDAGLATLHDKHVSKDEASQALIRKKDRFSIWIVSNCGDHTFPRNVMAESMVKAGLQLTKFGRCSNPLPLPTRWDPAFFEVVSRFKFYLSFENSFHCIDYFTEKLWNNALYSGAVPVIFGANLEDARASLPPKSFIHVEEFGSAKQLVDYLKHLDENATAYEEYLTWRTWTKYLNPDNLFSWEVPEQDKTAFKYLCRPPTGLCGLCRLLYNKTKTFPIIKDSGALWGGNENQECYKSYPETLKIESIKPLVT